MLWSYKSGVRSLMEDFIEIGSNGILCKVVENPVLADICQHPT